MIKTLNPPTEKMSYEEYLAWSEEQEFRTEWVDGEVVFKIAVEQSHQNIVNFLLTLLNLYVRLFKLGKVTTGPFLAKVLPNVAREPDLFFIAANQLEHLSEDDFEGGPAVVVEVISRSSVIHDRETKLREYQDAGVLEYWLIDPREGKQRADFYQRDANNNFALVATEEHERFESEAIKGFWLNPDWLWQTEEVEPLLKLIQIAEMPLSEIMRRVEQK